MQSSSSVTPDLIRGPAALSAVEEKRDPGSAAGATILEDRRG